MEDGVGSVGLWLDVLNTTTKGVCFSKLYEGMEPTVCKLLLKVWNLYTKMSQYELSPSS